MNKEGKENLEVRYMVAQAKKHKASNVWKRRNALNTKEKKIYKSLRQDKKSDKTKKQRIYLKESHKQSAKINATQSLINDCKKPYEYQIQSLKKFLDQPLNRSTLTPEELNTLFTKYKQDGHYKITVNLPPFTSLVECTQDTSNSRSNFYDATTRYSCVPDSRDKGFRSNESMTRHLWQNNNENRMEQNVYQHTNVQQDFKYNSYNQHSPLIDNDYRHVHVNRETEVHDRQEEIGTNETSGISNTKGFRITNEYQNYNNRSENFTNSMSDSHILCDDYLRESNSFLQNNTQYNDILWNGISHNNGFYINEHNNGATLAGSNSYPKKLCNVPKQSWNTMDPSCTTYTKDLVPYFSDKYNINDLYNKSYNKNPAKEQTVSYLYVPTSMYSFTNSSHIASTTHNNQYSVPDFNNFSKSSACMFTSATVTSNTKNFPPQES